jgi:hypothetical protein
VWNIGLQLRFFSTYGISNPFHAVSPSTSRIAALTPNWLLRVETLAQLKENQPSREAEPVTNATSEPTPFVELRHFAVRKILARNPQIAC